MDRISPERNVIGHFFNDVLPSFFCCHNPNDRDNCNKYLDKRPIDRCGLSGGFRLLRFLGSYIGLNN